MKYLSAFMHGPNDIRVEEVEIPKINDNQVLVKLKAAGICGSDIECFLGHSNEGRYDIAPYVPGHEWCGEVVETGKNVITLKTGDLVTGDCAIACNRCLNCKENINTSYCLDWRESGFMPGAPGGMGQYLVGEEQFTHKIPDEMNAEEGALVEPCSIAYYSIWGRDGFVSRTDDVVVFGAGPIGLFAATICKSAGANVMVVDPVEFRRNVAKKAIGADTIDPFNQDIKEEVLKRTNGQGASFVVECTGKDMPVGQTLEVTRAHAKIRYIGHSIGRKVPMEIGLAIWKGLNLQGSAGSPFFFPKTIKFMSRVKEQIDYSNFITHRFPLEKINEAFQTGIEHKDQAIKIMLNMD